ncbi:MAG: cobalamin-binding protein, partial [Betaproteobacteria bacterium]
MIRVAAFALFAAVSAAAHALQATDDRGVTISLVRPAWRMVTLAPHLAEIAFAAGAGAKLAGVSSFSRHPAEAQRLPVVASYGRVDVERLIALRPDLVLAW